MSIIHGSWIVQPKREGFFVWGETWRSLVNLAITTNNNHSQHPFGLNTTELISLLREHQLVDESFLDSATKSVEHEYIITIPSQKLANSQDLVPIFCQNLSDITDDTPIEIYPWQVSGFTLTSEQAISFFQAVSLNNRNLNYLGGDIAFWYQIYRWVLDLINRGKFLPGVEIIQEQSYGVWQPLLDSDVDLTRLAKFSQTMPKCCLIYTQDNQVYSQELLLRFVAKILDYYLKNNLTTNINITRAVSIAPWLRSLCNSLSENRSLFVTDQNNLQKIQNALYNWTLPIKEYLVTQDNTNLGENSYRVAFILEPPIVEKNKPQGDWSLKYCLQALDESEFLIDAELIWQNTEAVLNCQNRKIEQAQEILLKGLGLAARIYDPIIESLEVSHPINCELNPIQVYEFLRSIAWQLQNNGLGVIMPPGLASGENEHRIGVGITAQVTSKKGEKLSLKTLLKYKLSVAIGDTTVSKKEFEKLLEQQSPIVEINGKWLLLQPADVRAAQSVLNQSNEQLNLSVEDALRLSTGDTKTLVKLPVVKFEATGVLQELISNLTENKAVEPISNIKNLNGTLRPYQARGVGWLSFLEKWSLGACLADDMGLGKCVLPDTNIVVNGIIETAENIWKKYYQKIFFDGEGYWSKPSKKIKINSLDKKTGKIVQGNIINLYRQKISEKIRLITLKDGSKIGVTKQHKLLTNNGWNNIFCEGEYICVPAQLNYDGNKENLELIEFVAWQIAAGWESSVRATLVISQKDINILERLKKIILNISNKYSLKINHPKITIPNKQKIPYLNINSQSYWEFLTNSGYKWGQRSKLKSIPSFIMQANLDGIRVFLRNYFDAEAAVISSMRSIEISSASPILIEQISVLLRRFGIWLRISKKSKRVTNGSGIFRDYYSGTIGGNSIRKFYKDIGFGYDIKQNKLQEICQKETNTNVEGIPVSEIVAEGLVNTQLPIRHFGMNNNVYINGTQQFSEISLTNVVTSIDNIITGKAESVYLQLKSSKGTKNTLTAYQKLDREYLQKIRQQLQSMLDKEVFYCPIKSIEEIYYEGWVYDFEVAEHHNFVANNIICHNTVQTIGFLLNLQQEELLNKPTLLVCPTSVLNNWQREVTKFAPTLSCLVHHGDKRYKGKTFSKQVKQKDLVITSYSLVYRDIKTLSQVNWQAIVLDEAQNIKNPTTKQSQAVRQIPVDFRIALTGTPVENRLSELWSILDFLNPGFLGNRTFFQKRFANPIEKYGDRNSLNMLHSLVRPFILRRLKTDKTIIQDLPEKQEMNVFCGLSEIQAQLYQKLVDESLVKIEESEGIQRHGLILTLLLRLKQLCNHPLLISNKSKNTKPNKLITDVNEFGNESGKLIRLTEMLDEIIQEESYAIIFTQFSEWGKLLKFYLENTLNQEVLFLYGATRRQQRQEMIDRFQNDPNAPKIFILSLKAGGTGLNLTRANHVFHVDRWWNPAVENQATDRAFRIGQKQNVQVHKFVCSGTLEERINDIIESKQELAEQTIDAGEQWLTRLDTAQLRNLLLLDRDSIIDEDN